MKAEWFAGRLREERESSGLTQQQLADKAGMAWRTIAHLESGDRKPTWETVLALCAALGCTCEAFTRQPEPRADVGPGRPSKPVPEVQEPKRPRGRPPKATPGKKGK